MDKEVIQAAYTALVISSTLMELDRTKELKERALRAEKFDIAAELRDKEMRLLELFPSNKEIIELMDSLKAIIEKLN
jgi:hypothetical protein